MAGKDVEGQRLGLFIDAEYNRFARAGVHDLGIAVVFCPRDLAGGSAVRVMDGVAFWIFSCGVKMRC